MSTKDIVYTSPSRLDTFDRCKRKWWLTYCMKLPRIFSGADRFRFGRVLHKQIEHYLKGEPMFVDGWQIDEESKTSVEPGEAGLIQVLIQKAIDEGILERRATSAVELPGDLDIGTVGKMRLVIDHTDMISRIEDHKHSKSANYFKSANKLKQDIQLHCNAKWLIENLKKQGKVPPKIITLVHNQFLKDMENPAVRRREAEVTPAEVDKFFEERLIPACVEMRRLKHVTGPFDIQDPPPSACYGCDFVPICTGQETMAQYKKRVELTNSRIQEQKPDQEKSNMTTPTTSWPSACRSWPATPPPHR